MTPTLFAQISPQDIAIELGRRTFRYFIEYVDNNYLFNWHHEAFIHEINNVLYGDASKLILTCPPRHSKSQTVSRLLPAYILGVQPNSEIIMATHTVDFSRTLVRNVKQIMNSDEYITLFPKSVLADSRRVNYKGNTTTYAQLEFFDGSLFAVGVGGAVSGRGADYLIIDDYVRDGLQASSSYNDKVYTWFRESLLTRLSPHGKIIIICTRWSNNDLISKLIAEELPQWNIYSFPAIQVADNTFKHPFDERKLGEVLWPQRFPLEYIVQRKKEMGSKSFSALYQCSPIDDEGAVFSRKYFRYYSTLPNIAPQYSLLSVDTAMKENEENDFSVGTIINYYNKTGDFYLVDMFRNKYTFPDLLDEILAYYTKYRKKYHNLRLMVEDTANGTGIIQVLRKQLPQLPILTVRPAKSKLYRANLISPIFENGNFYLPEDNYQLDDIENELLSFPYSAHDDIVDTITQALQYIQEKTLSSITQYSSLNLLATKRQVIPTNK